MSDDEGPKSFSRWLIGVVVIPLLAIGVTLYVAKSGNNSNKGDAGAGTTARQVPINSDVGFNTCDKAAIFLNRDAASVGSTVLIGGRGFDPGERVEFSMQGGATLA